MTAPAGYGKTALLTQWRDTLRATGTRTSWMSVTGDQHEAAQLLTYLGASLIEAGVDLGPVERLVEQWFADVPIAAAVAAVVSQLARHTLPLVLLIDDVHHLSRPTVEQIFGPLLQPGLPQVHLAMSGRTRPHWPSRVCAVAANCWNLKSTRCDSVRSKSTRCFPISPRHSGCC